MDKKDILVAEKIILRRENGEIKTVQVAINVNQVIEFEQGDNDREVKVTFQNGDWIILYNMDFDELVLWLKR